MVNYTHHFNLLWEGYELLLLGNTVQTECYGLQNWQKQQSNKTIKYFTVSEVLKVFRGHGYLSVVSVVCCQVEVSATS